MTWVRDRSLFHFAAGLALVLASYSPAAAQIPTCQKCTLSVQHVMTIDGAITELDAYPILVTANRAGKFVVLEGNGLPSVYGKNGRFVRLLGKKGRGPGELTYASWIDAEIDDSLRVIDIDRIVVFDSALRPVRTIVGPTARFAWHAAFLRPTAYVSQSSVQDSRDLTRTMPLVVRSDSGRTLLSIEIPKINGQKTFIALGRKLADDRAFWLSETVVQDLLGYRITAMTDAGKRTVTFSQSRAWWINADFDREPVAALSKVHAIRQVDAHQLAVLIASPIKEWRSVVVNPRNMEGDRDRYETIIELLDTRTGGLIGSAHLPGYPVSLLSESRAAVYREDADGVPRVEIVRFSPGRE